MKTFEELDCWKKAVALRKKLSLIVKTFPHDEKFGLIDQILRSSRSVTENIAEGYGRFHYQEYIQYCRQSRGSLYEIIDHLIVAADEKYITEAELNEIRKDINECLALLNGFINYLVRAKSGNVIEEPQNSYTPSEVRDTDN